MVNHSLCLQLSQMTLSSVTLFPMHPSDDDVDLGTLSTSRLDKSQAQRRREGLEQKMCKEGRADLAKQVVKVDSASKMQSLRRQLEGMKDEQTKRDKERKEGKKVSKMSTKTREQEVADSKTVDQNPDAEKMAKQAQQNLKATEEQRKQEVTTEGG